MDGKIISILLERTFACLIVLFGSVAKDRVRTDSDIDIAFLLTFCNAVERERKNLYK